MKSINSKFAAEIFSRWLLIVVGVFCTATFVGCGVREQITTLNNKVRVINAHVKVYVRAPRAEQTAARKAELIKEISEFRKENTSSYGLYHYGSYPGLWELEMETRNVQFDITE
jgi:hypothetical protein